MDTQIKKQASKGIAAKASTAFGAATGMVVGVAATNEKAAAKTVVDDTPDSPAESSSGRHFVPDVQPSRPLHHTMEASSVEQADNGGHNQSQPLAEPPADGGEIVSVLGSVDPNEGSSSVEVVSIDDPVVIDMTIEAEACEVEAEEPIAVDGTVDAASQDILSQPASDADIDGQQFGQEDILDCGSGADSYIGY